MEDDDDFGELYTDVLQSFPSTSQHSSSSPFAPPPQKPSDPAQSASRGIDLNLDLDEDEMEYAERSGAAAGTSNSGGSQTLAPHVTAGRVGLELNLSGAGVNYRDVQAHGDGKSSENRELGKDDGGSGGGGGNFDEESFRFDLEEDVQDGNGDVGPEPVIPGLTSGPGGNDGFDDLGREEGGGDDWDSDDSEDDLQIVLNDTSHGPTAMEMGGEFDDGQDQGLGKGVDGDGVGFQHPGMEEREWGDDGAQAADGEKKEGSEVAKLNQGIAMAQKPGYIGHGYHPFHSQFKYVRPGAAPLQGAPPAGPVGAPGQLRPLVNLGPLAGRGRGDWRPPGMQNGYGGPGWGNNAAGRGRGLGIGLDFTLPSHKTILEVDIDGFEEKPWNNPGVDVTDFFNFGLTEESWKGYCKQLEQSRVASTMQTRIRVYESGRSEQTYDPDMPPELAAATGVNENAAENVNFRRTDANTELGKSSVTPRPPMPTGRAIEVETGSGERLPSIDTRPPRMRYSDAIIEIVCEGFAEGVSSEDGAPKMSEHHDPSKTNLTENHKSEEMPGESNRTEARSSEERRLSSPMKARHHSGSSSSRGDTPVHSSGSVDRHNRRLEDKSPHSISRDDNLLCDQRDGSTERNDGKRTVSVSPDKVVDDDELSADHIAKDDDALPMVVDSAAMEDDILHDKAPPAKNQDTVLPHSKKQKAGSRGDLSSDQDNGEQPKATRSGDNSKPRPVNSKEYSKSHDFGEEVVQGGRGASRRNSERPFGDDGRNVQKRNYNETHDMERSRDVVKGREDLYTHRDGGGLAKPSYVKYESSDKRKERDSSEGVRQRRGEDPHERRVRTNDYRKQDPRLFERGNEKSSKYSSRAWDGDRIEKEDNLYSRKQIDNEKWRGHHDMDGGLRQRERDSSLKARHENVEDNRRRMKEENLRRDYLEKEEMLLSRKESPGLRHREREDLLDPRKRDDLTRTRENTKYHQSVRHKDEVRMEREKNERPNERDDHHRTKQYREGSMTKREREEVREPIRSVWSTEDKRISHAEEKDDFNDAVRYADQKRRDGVDDVHRLHHRGHEDRYARQTPSSNHDSKLRIDRPSPHTDHSASGKHKTTNNKPKESAKNKEYDARSQNSLNISKRAKDDNSSHRSEKGGTKHSSGQGSTVHQTQAHPNLVRKRGEEPTTDDDDQLQLKKGRSKMERWTSHKERDFAAITKSSSSLKAKEPIRSSIYTDSSVPVEPADKPAKAAEIIDPKPSVEEKAQQGADNKKDNLKDTENKNLDPPQTADQHLDTVAKLKKRSERFKLPLPSEKDTMNKKKDTEALLPSQTETPPAEPEVKSERPPRKRRWISS
ncbi:hypothetical protein QQ045_022399 [Rhodiola kirilowii]